MSLTSFHNALKSLVLVLGGSSLFVSPLCLLYIWKYGIPAFWASLLMLMSFDVNILRVCMSKDNAKFIAKKYGR